MPRNTDLLGIFMIMLLMSKKREIIPQLHRMTELLNRLDTLSSTASSLPDMSILMQKIGPIMSALNSTQENSSDEYYEEKQNAIF